jgi:hypothetical protein
MRTAKKGRIGKGAGGFGAKDAKDVQIKEQGSGARGNFFASLS